MLSFFSTLIVAQATPTSFPSPQPSPVPTPPPKVLPPPREIITPSEPLPTQEESQAQEVFRFQDVRPLPGQLDKVPVFNSNSPEVVQTEGILLSTFPSEGKAFPEAHLNFSFKGRFDIFTHHIARPRNSTDGQTLFQGLMLHNPGDEPAKIEVINAASYLTRPDALFIELPPLMEDPNGRVFSGPGSRVVNDILRGRRQGNWQPMIEVPPKQSVMLMNLPIPVGGMVALASNGRSTLIRLQSDAPVYIANLAMFAPKNPDGSERIPTLEEWERLLVGGSLSGPRDTPPTPPKLKLTQVFYGRVAGVAAGSEWKSRLTDNNKVDYLTIPRSGQAFSYGLSTLFQGTLGTGQVQSAPMLVRYPDTAYEANGNYGIQYSLTLPLYNPSRQPQKVNVTLQTPIKGDAGGGLLFFKPPENRVFFRGPVRVRYRDDAGSFQTRYVHLVQQRGQEADPLITLTMKPGDRHLVQVDVVYPADSTPPQVLTVETIP